MIYALPRLYFFTFTFTIFYWLIAISDLGLYTAWEPLNSLLEISIVASYSKDSLFHVFILLFGQYYKDTHLILCFFQNRSKVCSFQFSAPVHYSDLSYDRLISAQSVNNLGKYKWSLFFLFVHLAPFILLFLLLNLFVLLKT